MARVSVITDTMEELFLTDAKTPLGMLQRGRGEGYLWAVSAPAQEAHPLLIECITHDSRSDWQLESRSSYFAELVLRTGLNVSPIERYLGSLNEPYAEQLGPGCFAIQTLANLAMKGHRQALDVLRRHVAMGAGWYSALCHLGDFSEGLTGLDEVVVQRFGAAALGESVGLDDFHWEPFKTWAETNETLRRIHESKLRETVAVPEVEFDPSLATPEILRLVDSRNRWKAIHVLEQRRSEETPQSAARNHCLGRTSGLRCLHGASKVA